jgi:antitoxin component YwqK of YwqJK toxin-antitoxin module
MGIVGSLLLGTALAQPASDGGVLRHAVVVGANDGGPTMEPLLYAERDAGRFVDVLTELGGFEASDVTLLRSPDRDELDSALRQHAELAQENPQDLFLFYYSGHADAVGLKLGQEQVPFSDLKQQIRDLPAEVSLGVLDACRSGEITRIKGFKVTAPFATEDNLSAKGEAWLTATAADEQAQESDRLQGSFFTHYLLSGLRGAADARPGETGDGVVSLVEAYDYAFNRTVAHTGGTDGGTQHPGYDFRLQGQGDLALTDVGRASARIVFPPALSGEITVLRLPEGVPVAEVAKPHGAELVVALPAGRYELKASGPEGYGVAQVGLHEGSSLTVREFRQLPQELATAKGAPSGVLAVPTDPGGQTAGPATAGPPSAGPAAPGPATPSEEAVDILEQAPPDAPETTPAQNFVSDFKQAAKQVGKGWRRLKADTQEIFDELSPGSDTVEPDAPEHAHLLQTEHMPAAARACDGSGPDCLRRLLESGAVNVATGEIRLLHPSGGLAGVGSLQDGKPVDDWVFFYDSGERQSAGTYLNGKPSGTWVWWWPNSKKRVRGSYVSGKRSGVWTEYYEHGKHRKRTIYSSGEPGGKQTEWYDNGRRKSQGEVLGSHRYGLWRYWYDNGKKRARGHFDRVGRAGAWKTWYANGRKSAEGNYVDDQRHGGWTHWHKNGEKSAHGRYVDGQKTGFWREWNNTGKSAGRGSYIAGDRTGRWVLHNSAGQRSVKRYEPGAPEAAVEPDAVTPEAVIPAGDEGSDEADASTEGPQQQETPTLDAGESSEPPFEGGPGT